MASVEQIGVASERNVARNVMSLLMRNTSAENVAKVDGLVFSAYNLLKKNGEDVTELRLKEVVSGIVKGEIDVQSPSTGITPSGPSDLSPFKPQMLPADTGTFVNQNQNDLELGQGVLPGPARPYENLKAANYRDDNFTTQAIDFAGALTWNFLNGLLIGIPGLAYEKGIKNLIGANSAAANFIDGVKTVETSAGKYGEAAGTLASFVGPGGFVKGGIKGAGLVSKANLVGKTFGLGGRVTKGVAKSKSAGLVDEAAGSIGKAIKTELTAAELKLEAAEKTAKALSEGIKNAKVVTEGKALTGGGIFQRTMNKAASDMFRVNQEVKKSTDAVEKLRKLASKEAGISSLARKGINKSVDDLFDLKKGMSIKDIEKAGPAAFRDVLKGRFVSSAYRSIYKEVGDDVIAKRIIERATSSIDDVLDDIAKGTTTWGEAFAKASFLPKGVSSTVGKLSQNFFEEAIGFTAHTMLYSTFASLEKADSLSKEELLGAVKHSAEEVPHSIRTAFIFATGGGVLVPGLGTQFGVIPMKAFFQTRSKQPGQILDHIAGRMGVHKDVLAGGMEGALNQIVKMGRITVPKQGLRGAESGASIWKKIRQRGLVDYARLGDNSPESIAFIGRRVERLLRNTNASGLPYMSNVGGGSLSNALSQLESEIAKGTINRSGNGALKTLTDLLQGIARNTVEHNSGIISKAFLKDSIKTLGTAASIAYSGGDIHSMTRGVETGEMHLADLLSHLAFSFLSASHPIINTHGRDMVVKSGKDGFSLPRVFHEEQQMKAVMSAIGIDYGEPMLHSVIKDRVSNLTSGDNNHREVVEISKGAQDITFKEAAGFEIRSDNNPGDWRNSATFTEVAEYFKWLKKRGIKFKEGTDAELLNKLLFERDSVSEKDLEGKYEDAAQMLAAGVHRIKSRMVENHLATDVDMASFRLTESAITNSMSRYMGGVVRDISRISESLPNAIKESFGSEGRDIGEVSFDPRVLSEAYERLNREGLVSNLPENEVAIAINNILETSHAVGHSFRHRKPLVVDNVEQAVTLIREAASSEAALKKRFETATFTSKEIVFDTLAALEGSYANSAKRVLNDGMTVPVEAGDGLTVDVGKSQLLKAAVETGILQAPRGAGKEAHYVLNFLDPKSGNVDYNKLNAYNVEFTENLIRVLRELPEVRTEGGKELGAGEINGLFTKRTFNIEGQDYSFDQGLKGLAVGMGLDMGNGISVSNIVRQMQADKYARVSRFDAAAFDIFRKMGLVYYDNKRGDVIAQIASSELDVATPENIATRRLYKELLEAKAAARNLDISEIDQTIKEQIQPIVDRLVEAGLVAGWGDQVAIPDNRFGLGDNHVDRLLDVIEAFQFKDSAEARAAAGLMIEKLSDTNVFAPTHPDYKSVQRITSHIVRLMGGSPTVRDWMNLKKIATKMGVLGGKFQENRFKEAVKEAEKFIYEEEYIDSVIKTLTESGIKAELNKEYRDIIGEHTENSYSIAKIAMETGLSTQEMRTLARDIKHIADTETKADAIAKVKDRIGKIPNIDKSKITEEGYIGIYNRAANTENINVVSLGDFMKRTLPEQEGDVAALAGASVKVANDVITKGYLTNLRKALGVDVALIDPVVNFNGQPLNIFRKHSDPKVDADLRQLIKNIELGNYNYIEEATGSNFSEKRVEKRQSVIIPFGDMGNKIMIYLPSDVSGAKAFSKSLKAVYDSANVKEFRTDEMIEGMNTLKKLMDNLDAARTGKEVKDAISEREGTVAKAMMLVQKWNMLKGGGMELLDRAIAADKGETIESRLRQANSRSFTPMNDISFRAALDFLSDNGHISSTYGYTKSDNGINVLHVSDNISSELASALKQGGVTRADGQVFMADWLLKAQAVANGVTYDQNLGVLKNMIISEQNGAAFITKNAGTFNPYLESFMKQHNIAAIVMDSSAKISLGTEGRINGASGESLSIHDIANGKNGTPEGVIKIQPSDLRFNKAPHASKATIGMQMENMLASRFVDEIRNTYFAGQTGENGTAYGIQNFMHEVLNGSPVAKAKFRKFYLERIRETSTSLADASISELSNADLSTLYMMSSPLASPTDFWFSGQGMGTMKKAIFGNSLFRTKEKTGVQDILAADVKGVFHTNEALASDRVRKISLLEQFDNKGDGIMLALDVGVDNAAKDVAEFFGYGNRENYYNKIGVSGGESAKDLEAEFTQSKYGYRRLYRMGQGAPGKQNSFMFDLIKKGIARQAKGAVFKNLNSKTTDADIAFINDFMITMIQRGGPNGKELREHVTEADIDRFERIVGREVANEIADKVDASYRENSDSFSPGWVELGYMHDVISAFTGKYDYAKRSIGSNVGKSEVTWGIAGVNQRYPSARPNDTIPAVFLGFADKRMGNQFILNYTDAVLKGEADFDIDNYNYFFRVPKGYFGEINRLRSSIGINQAAEATKYSTLTGKRYNPLDPEHAEAYARSQARANFLRGHVIKIASLIEKLSKDGYSFTYELNGIKYKLEPKFKDIEAALDSPEGLEAFMQSAKMVQEVIDSKKGFLSEEYMSEDFDPFQKIARNFYEVKEIESGERRALNEDHFELMQAASTPYRRLLNFSKQSWTGDKSESMPWDVMIDIVQGYRSIVRGSGGIKNGLTDFVNTETRGKFKDLTIDMNASQSLVERAIPTILNTERIFNHSDTSWMYGREANELSAIAKELNAVLSKKDESAKDEALAEILDRANTKNFNVRNLVSKIGAVQKRLNYSQAAAARGDKLEQARSRVLRDQLRDMQTVNRAYYRKLDANQDIMMERTSTRDRNQIHRNTVAAEAIKLSIVRTNVPSDVLVSMRADAASIQKLRGRLYASEFNKLTNLEGPIYDEARQVHLDNAVAKYLEKYYYSADLAGYDKTAAIYALIMPQAERAYRGNMGKRYIKYKTVPADLLHSALRIAHENDPVGSMKIMKHLAESHAVSDAFNNGRSGELDTMLDWMDRLANTESLVGLSTRINMNRGVMIDKYALSRNIGLIEAEYEGQSKVSTLHGLKLDRIVKLAESETPESIVENITITGRLKTGKGSEPGGIFEKFGEELPSFIRVQFDNDRFIYDENGHMLETVTRKLKKEGRLDDKTKSETQFLVAKEVDRMNRSMAKIVLRGESQPGDRMPNGIDSKESLFAGHSFREAMKGCN